MKKGIVILLIFCVLELIAATVPDSLLIKADRIYFSGDLYSAYEIYCSVEKNFPDNESALTGLYNTTVHSGDIKAAGEYAEKLYEINSSDLNRNRVIYSEALSGRTSRAASFLKKNLNYQSMITS